METNEQTFSGLQIDVTNRVYLGESAKWAKFLSIVGFVMCGLLIILAFFIGAIMSTLFPYGDLSNIDGAQPSVVSGVFGGGLITVLYILIALIYFFPCLFLYRFADRMQLALRSDQQEYMNTSFENLKSLFKFMGIFTIVMLGLYAVGILVVLVSMATVF